MARIHFKRLRGSEKNDQKEAPLKTKDKKLTQTSLYDHVTQDTWGWELFGLSVCISALVSIFAVLFTYNQKPLPHVAAGISLNTVISLLATLARSAVIFVAASIIAQQKWLRFVPCARSLRDVDIYDNATRGPLGSFFLLISLRLNLITAIAAVIVVLALGFEPFVQQSIRYPSRPYQIAGYRPLLQATNTVSFANDSSSLQKSVAVDTALRQSLYAAAIDPMQPDCLTNTCNWSHYTTVAICWSCEDSLKTTTITSRDNIALRHFAYGDYFGDLDTFVDLQVQTNINVTVNSTYTVSFGGDYKDYVFNTTFLAWTRLSSQSDARTWAEVYYPEESVVDLSTSDAMPYNNSDPLRTLGYVKVNLSEDGLELSLSSASVCTVTPCAQNISTFAANGSLYSKILDQDYGRFEVQYAGAAGSVQQWIAKLGDEEFRSTLSTEGIFNGAYDILVQLYNAFDNVLGNTTRVLHAGVPVADSWPSNDYPGDPHGAGLIGGSSDVMQFISDVPNSTAKIAQGFTNFIVRGGNKSVEGEGFTVELFVDVRWPWLAFPLALVLICFVILVVTIYQTRRTRIPIWKTSPFPLIFDYSHDEMSLLIATTHTNESERESPATNPDEENQAEGVLEPGTSTVTRRKTPASKKRNEAKKAKMNGQWVNSMRNHEKLADGIDLRLMARDKRWSFEKVIDIFE